MRAVKLRRKKSKGTKTTNFRMKGAGEEAERERILYPPCEAPWMAVYDRLKVTGIT